MEWSIPDEGSQTGVYTDMEQWTDVRRAVLVEGISKRAACRRFGIHWDTLQRILQHSAPPGYVRKQASEKSVIAPWLGRLGELIEANRDLPRKQRYTVKRMWDVLCGEVGEFIDRNENVLLIGNSGTGKTHLAIALGLAACHEGRSVRFFGVTGLVTALLEAREDRRLERMLKQLPAGHGTPAVPGGRQDLLVLDELGYVPFTKAGAELLFEVVSRAYERQSLIITTNLPFEQWVEVCGSERLTGAMLDRLTHRVHIVEANGESYRLRDSQQRIRRKRTERIET